MPVLLASIRNNAIGEFCFKLIDRFFFKLFKSEIDGTIGDKKENFKLIYACFRFAVVCLSTFARSRNANHEEIQSRDKRKVEESIA